MIESLREFDRFTPKICVAAAEKTVIARDAQSGQVAAELIVDCSKCNVFERIERIGAEESVDSQFRARIRAIVQRQCQNLPSMHAESGEVDSFLPQVREL